MSARSRPSLSERVYGLLLALYPPAFRDRFGADMRELFRDQWRAARAHGGALAVARLWPRIVAGLVRSALLEHALALHARHVASRRSAATAGSPTRKDTMWQNLSKDLRFAIRMLRKSPVFTGVAVLVITIGTGAVTTIFSAANALVLRPLPGASNASQLVEIQRVQGDGAGSLSASYPYYRRLNDGVHSLSGIAGWSMIPLTISAGRTGNEEGSASLGNIVTGNYFRVLGVRPAIGRFFAADEDSTPGTRAVVVLSHGFWRGRFGGDSSIVGRSIRLNGHPFTVIGVAPAGFHGVFNPIRTDAWVPIMMQQQLRPRGDLTSSGAAWLELFGRLRDGTSRDVARAELARLTTAHAAAAGEPAEFRLFTGVRLASLSGLPSDSTGVVLGFMALLLTAAGLVLLIAGVNVAAMLLARAVARRREMAVRIALGAGRARLVRQLLTESVLLFLLGAVGGVIVATQTARALAHVDLHVDMPIALDLAPDARVLLFTLVVALITGVVFGLAPALQASRVDINAQLRDDTAGGGARRSRTRSALVVGQMAFSLLLLVTAGLFLRALDRGQRVDPGMDIANVAIAGFNAQTYGYDDARGQAFYTALKERLTALPGVSGVSYTAMLPLTMSNMGDEIRVDGYQSRAGESTRGVPVNFAEVDADYFAVVRIPLLRGRSFGPTDDEHSPMVAVVNQTFTRRFWPPPGGDAIGHTFRLGESVVTIIGEARDAKYSSLSEEATPYVYFPLSQRWSASQIVLVRTKGEPVRVAPLIRNTVRSLDPAIPAPQVTTLREATSIVLLPQRVAAGVTGSLGIVGLLLAAVGLYGIIAYSVSQRTREIGIRVALGARRGDVLGLVVREGMRLVLMGMMIGLVLALAATRAMTRFLFNVSPIDALTFVGVSSLLAGVALAASYLPARRAAATHPTTALRYD